MGEGAIESLTGQSSTTIRSISSVIPLLDRVLVKRFKPETKTASGIFLPSSSASSPLPEASVIAAGPGAPGKVLLPSWGGSSIKVGEEVRRAHVRMHD